MSRSSAAFDSGTAFSVRGRVRTAVTPQAAAFPLSAVRVLHGPFRHALEVNRAYLLHLNPDRLLSGLRQNAGLPPKAPMYPGWDSGGSGTIGHYLSACAQMVAATGDSALRKRVDYVVAEMVACQKASDGGLYSFGWDKTDYFPRMRRGELLAPSVNGWYILHKNLAGLRDAYVQCGSVPARDALVRLANWCVDVTTKLTPDQWQMMLNGEHGGPHEILADVYALTGDTRFRDLAEKFRHRKVYEPLARGDDTVLNGLHANTQIPKFIGYARLAELTGNRTDYDAARNFWNAVTDHRSWANGGNSQFEAFFAPSEFERKVTEVCGPETCNTYNMLKLTEQLYTREPSARYLDFYERALYNSVLPSIGPEPGGYVYYTPMRPGHYRVFSRPDDAFWCCVGTGMENPAKYGEMIYAHRVSGPGAGTLYVNLFLPSELTWKEQQVTIRQETRFPEEDRTVLTVTTARPWKQTIAIRCPEWVEKGAMQVRVNGKAQAVRAMPGTYVQVSRVWRSGDKIEVRLPMRLTAALLPDSRDWMAFRYGPLLLAGALGTEGLSLADFRGGGPQQDGGQTAKKALPLYEAPVVQGNVREALARITPTVKPLQFRTRGLVHPQDVTLVPLYQLHYQRYAVYWQLANADTVREIAEKRKAAEGTARALAAATIDRVQVGETASETAHHLQAERSASGGGPFSMEYPCWRDAKSFFRYDLQVVQGQKNGLRVVYWGSDDKRQFTVLVDGEVVGSESLTAKLPGDYLMVTYPIPIAITTGKSKITVEFRAMAGSTAGGVFDVRTVRL